MASAVALAVAGCGSSGAVSPAGTVDPATQGSASSRPVASDTTAAGQTSSPSLSGKGHVPDPTSYCRRFDPIVGRLLGAEFPGVALTKMARPKPNLTMPSEVGPANSTALDWAVSCFWDAGKGPDGFHRVSVVVARFTGSSAEADIAKFAGLLGSADHNWSEGKGNFLFTVGQENWPPDNDRWNADFKAEMNGVPLSA